MYKYDLTSLSDKENDIIKIAKRIDCIFNSFKTIKNSIDTNITRRDNIDETFNTLTNDFQNFIEHTYNCGQFINKSITEYKNSEHQIHNLLNSVSDTTITSMSMDKTKIKSNIASINSHSLFKQWFTGFLDKFTNKITHLKNFLDKNGINLANKKYPSYRRNCSNYIDSTENSIDYNNGFITIYDLKIPIYIPEDYNSDLNDENWKVNNSLSKQITNLDVNWTNAIGHFGDTLEEDNGISYKEIGKKQIIDYGNFKGGERVQSGLFVLEMANAVINNAKRNVLSITVQEKGNQKRAIIQIGSYNNTLMKRAGTKYKKLAFGYWGEPGHNLAVKGLNDYLSTLGYGKYVDGEKHTNLRLTVDSSHATDPYLGYIGVNDNGELTLTPKLYKDDNVQIITEKTILFQYYYGDYDVKYDMYNDLRESEPTVIKNSTILNDANKQYTFSN